jgi:hypothetical protein
VYQGLEIGLMFGVGFEVARIGIEGRYSWGLKSCSRQTRPTQRLRQHEAEHVLGHRKDPVQLRSHGYAKNGGAPSGAPPFIVDAGTTSPSILVIDPFGYRPRSCVSVGA